MKRKRCKENCAILTKKGESFNKREMVHSGKNKQSIQHIVGQAVDHEGRKLYNWDEFCFILPLHDCHLPQYLWGFSDLCS